MSDYMYSFKKKDIIDDMVLDSKNNGKYIILGYINHKTVKIKFIDTGSIITCRPQKINTGSIKDPLLPSVEGIGYFGIGKHTNKGTGGKNTKAYKNWCAMLRRCYNVKRLSQYKTYIGCSVCVEWHNFQNFAEWHNLNYRCGMVLDKDIKVSGNKIYSPNTCLYVTPEENNADMNEKRAIKYNLTSPDDEVYIGDNLSAFCTEHNLDRECMRHVVHGTSSKHNGWTKNIIGEI